MSDLPEKEFKVAVINIVTEQEEVIIKKTEGRCYDNVSNREHQEIDTNYFLNGNSRVKQYNN